MLHALHVIAGFGEVGQAIAATLTCAETSPVENRCGLLHFDVMGPRVDTRGKFLHVCFPWSDRFVELVGRYSRLILPKDGICVIHSTVPIGTSRQCEAVHSPVRGIHPHLKRSIRTFVKYFGGDRADEAAEPFERVGVYCEMVRNPEDTEALKLWSTTQYGVSILVEKAIHDYCEKHGLDFDLVYRRANESYNLGYRELGHSEYERPVLREIPGPIGGHCVIPNAELLDNWLPRLLVNIGGPNAEEESTSSDICGE